MTVRPHCDAGAQSLGTSVRVQLVVVCDVRRSTGCQGRDDVVASNGTAGIARARREARDVGWSQEQHGSQLPDACHTGVGFVSSPRQPDTAVPVPQTIGEAADWNRWREPPEERRRGQRSPRADSPRPSGVGVAWPVLCRV